MPSSTAAQHKFSLVPKATIERSVFDRSHAYKTTFDAGYLIPFYVDWALPGDTFHLQCHAVCRLSTPMKPLLDNMYLETFFFAVPYRLVWANFVKMMGEQVNPGDSTSYVIPKMTVPVGGYNVGTVQDYMGIPTGVACTAASWTHSSLPLRAYYRIYNEWFRDQNLINSVGLGTEVGDGPDSGAVSSVVKRGKRHDYFTSCLPWTQKGTAQSVPLTGVADVKGIALNTAKASTAGNPPASKESGGSSPSGWTAYVPLSDATSWYGRDSVSGTGGNPVIQADLSTATSTFTINALRQAFQIQKYLERLARGGSRYTEVVRAEFGVISPDARLQRTEYLGGGSTPMVIASVAQTTASTNVAPSAGNTVATQKDTGAGNLAAYGTALVSGGHGFVKSFTEHCLIIGIVNVRADLTYQQGLYRMWSHSTVYDHFHPALAHIGEQSVLNQEIYLADNASQNLATFGYQERYGEYRYKPSLVTGLFRSSAAGTLHVWHLAESFAALPTLGQTFIEDQTTSILTRNLAVPTEPDIIGDFWFSIKCARPMPVYGVPGMIDHF